jgi:hypothetical protein
MDWFKQNPFLGGLAAAAAVLLLGSGYFLFDAYSRYQTEATTFEEQRLALGRLQDNKPFPNDENVRLMREELDGAKAIFEDIGRSFQVEVPTVTPQGFQDRLREKVNDIASRAAANGVTLGEGFYLSFEAYETQPPPAAAAGPLALQLESIHAVASILVDARVRQITAINRPLLSSEAAPANPEDESERKPRRPAREDGKEDQALPDLVLAPFDVSFAAEQSAFRTAFNRILEAEPPVFVRLVGVTNSVPAAPKKGAETAEGESTTALKPVLGREVAIVNLRLAAVSAGSVQAD